MLTAQSGAPVRFCAATRLAPAAAATRTKELTILTDIMILLGSWEMVLDVVVMVLRISIMKEDTRRANGMCE